VSLREKSVAAECGDQHAASVRSPDDVANKFSVTNNLPVAILNGRGHYNKNKPTGAKKTTYGSS
jgi:hypothetical protein